MNITLPLDFSEENFLKAIARREQWAQKKLYEDYYSSMMGVCLRYSNNGDDALDILHEGFIKVFKNIGKFRPGTSLSAWIRRIMVNTAIDFYRKNIRRRTEDLDQAYQVSSSDVDVVSQYTEKEILIAVQTLTPGYRTVFNLYIIEGYSHREIAEKLGITESTSRSNLVKARSKLQVILTKQANFLVKTDS